MCQKISPHYKSQVVQIFQQKRKKFQFSDKFVFQLVILKMLVFELS